MKIGNSPDHGRHCSMAAKRIRDRQAGLRQRWHPNSLARAGLGADERMGADGRDGVGRACRPHRQGNGETRFPRMFTSAVHAAAPRNAGMKILLFLGGLRPPKPSPQGGGWGNPVSPYFHLRFISDAGDWLYNASDAPGCPARQWKRCERVWVLPIFNQMPCQEGPQHLRWRARRGDGASRSPWCCC